MRSFGTYRLFSAIVTGTLLASPVFAAEAEAESGGLPQFDVTFFPGQLFWLAISFVLLYLLMTYVALPKVKATQDRRHEALAKELAAASQANDQAKAIIEQYERALADARNKSHTAVNDIMAQAAKLSSERQGAQQQELHKRLREAESKIAAARDVALTGAQASAVDIAETIIQRITGTKMRVSA